MGIALPNPSSVHRQTVPQVQRSDHQALGLMHSRLRDTAVPALFRITWSNQRDGARHAIREHYYTNFHSPFSWTPPREDTAIQVMWRGAPRATRQGQRWTVTAEFELSLA